MFKLLIQFLSDYLCDTYQQRCFEIVHIVGRRYPNTSKRFYRRIFKTICKIWNTLWFC